jgi:Type II secretion system (T2SS), protein F
VTIVQWAALLGFGLAVSAALGVAALIGTTRPPAPVSRWRRLARRVWHGGTTARRERLVYRARLGAAIVVGLLAGLISGLPVAGLAAAAAVLWVPWLLAGARIERQATVRVEAVEMWARQMRDEEDTGTGLKEALLKTVDKAPAAIATQVQDLGARIRAGWDLEEALWRFGDDMSDHLTDQIVNTLVEHAASRGTKLGDALVGVAKIAAAEVTGRREVTKQRARSRFEVKFLLWLAGGAFTIGILSPHITQPYRQPFGVLVLVVGVALIVALMAWVRALSMPERYPRFLNAEPREEADVP